MLYNVILAVGPQHREIGIPISTNKASWLGPNTEKLEPQFLQTMRVGVVQRNEFCENIIFVPSPDEHVY